MREHVESSTPMLDYIKMGTRHRTRVTLAATGLSYATFGPNTIANDTITVLNRKAMDDTVGSFGDNPLLADSLDWNIKPMQGRKFLEGGPDFTLLRELRKCPPELYRGFVPIHEPTDGPQDPVTQAIARTNPSRPLFNLPAWIGELKDLPGLFKIAGDTLLRKGANAFLSYQFGWRPLISDMNKALNFSSQFRSRAEEWRRLHSSGGLKRRINLGIQTVQSDPQNVVIHSSNGLVVAKKRSITTSKTWATLRWRPDEGNLPPTTKADSERYARALLGAGVSGFTQAAWQLMPWSWMIDWFGNIGDYLQATDNTIGASSGVVNVMTTTITNTEFTVLQDQTDSWILGGDGSCTLKTITRAQGSGPTITATLPNLSARQLSILGALGIQRVPRSLLR